MGVCKFCDRTHYILCSIPVQSLLLKKSRWKKREHVKKSKRSSEKLKSNFKDTNKTIFMIKMISVVSGKRGKLVTADEKLSSLELKTKPGKQSRVPSL